MERPVEVVVSDLHLAAGRLRDAGQRLQDGLSGVDLEMRELLGSGWKGDAASAFATAWDRWHNGAGQVVRGIQTMSDLLRIAGDAYAKTDEQGAGALASTLPAADAGGGPSAPSGSPATGAAAQSATGSPSSGPTAGAAAGAAEASAAASSVSSVGQLGGQIASGLAQAGQTAGAMVQQIVQAVEQSVEDAVEKSKDPEHRREAAREVPR